jgi:hypothetical protein
LAGNYFFRYGGFGDERLFLALNHNKRELQKERGAKQHIDVVRTPLNYCLHGDKTPHEIDNYARSLIALAGIKKLRKNVVMGVEVLYSLPIDSHKKDTKQFFHDCYQWTLKTFEGELLSFDIHLDESAPHAHAIILPLIAKKMQGDKLKGDRALIKKRRKSFYDEVGCKYGFGYQDSEPLNATNKQALAREVIKRLSSDSVQKSAIYSWVRDKVHEDPKAVAQMMGIEVSTANASPTKHFVDIARSKGKGEFIR